MDSVAASPSTGRSMTLFVCVTCRDANHVVSADAPCAGARLHANIVAAVSDPLIHIVPVECLSVCKRTCAVSFAAPGKWTYVYGDIAADSAAETILDGARLYAQAPDGLIPWKQRPEALKKGAVARVPPLPHE
jgi:predicted metal-binding protein